MDDLDFNISTDFFLPVLGIDLAITGTTGYLNSYVNCPDLTDILIKNPVYILYNTEDLDLNMERVYEDLINNKNFILEQRLDKYHILFCFSIPEKYSKDYELIIRGKYSKTSSSFKEIFSNDNITDLWQYKILYRDPEYMKDLEHRIGIIFNSDCEIYDKIDMINETILISSYRDLRITG